MPPRSSRTAFRNFAIVLAITVAVLIYSYGWTVTDIDLTKPQEPSRQVSLNNALREMLSPRIFDQDRELVGATAPVLNDCSTGDAPDVVQLVPDQPGVTISPTCGVPGDVITVRATGFAPEADGQIRWVPITGQSRPRNIVGTRQSLLALDDTGSFEGQIEIPRIAGQAGEVHQIEFRASSPSGAVRFSDTANEVIRRMTETVFMALVATSLAIPIAVMISFFAAHNLMRPIRMPVGSAMLWVIALPIGYALGAAVFGAVGSLMFNVGRGEGFTFAPALIPLVFGLGTTAATRLFPIGTEPVADRLKGIGQRLLLALVIVGVLGLLGGLGMTVQRLLASLGETVRPAEVGTLFEWLTNAIADGITAFGHMLGIIGGIIGLGILPIAGVIGGVVLASSAVTLAKPMLRSATGALNYGLGLVLGGLSGALLMTAIGAIGMSAALFGLFPPLVAALDRKSVV